MIRGVIAPYIFYISFKSKNYFKHMKFQDLHIKDKIAYLLSVASFMCGAVLVFCGMYLDPVGIIDSSVLSSLGIFLSFSGALIGLNLHYSTELHTFKSEVKRTIESKKEQ